MIFPVGKRVSVFGLQWSHRWRNQLSEAGQRKCSEVGRVLKRKQVFKHLESIYTLKRGHAQTKDQINSIANNGKLQQQQQQQQEGEQQTQLALAQRLNSWPRVAGCVCPVCSS